MSHSTFARITFFVLYQKLSFAAQPIQPSSPFVAFEALGGVDDAAECRRAVDADILEFVTVAVVRRLMGHARIERIAHGRILLRDVPAMHAHLAPGGGMPPSAAPSATFGEVLHIARKLAYLVLEPSLAVSTFSPILSPTSSTFSASFGSHSSCFTS